MSVCVYTYAYTYLHTHTSTFRGDNFWQVISYLKLSSLSLRRLNTAKMYIVTIPLIQKELMVLKGYFHQLSIIGWIKCPSSHCIYN